MALITSSDKRYSRSWANLPVIAWTCNTCFALVAQSNFAAHTDYHKKHEGFGS